MSAHYCASDDSIGWDMALLDDEFAKHGDFAPVVILAHEWGHLNQARLGLFGILPSRSLELHADCQAGIFAAVEMAAGLLQDGDLGEAYQSLCRAGDQPTVANFYPGDHGTCSERTAAFEIGYRGAQRHVIRLCRPGQDVLRIVRELCPTFS